MSSGPKKDWTVLYYLNGNNDLEPKLTRNLLDAEQVGSTDQVNVVAQLTRGPHDEVCPGKKKTGLDGDWVGTRRYHLEAAPTARPGAKKKLVSQPLETQETPVNAGESKSLSDFLSWGVEKYPAKRYMVVIGDHGKGFVGTGFDYLYKDNLNLTEIKSALYTVQQKTGTKPDVLVFDACEMGQLEVAYQFKDQAGFMVASEEIIGVDGLPHTAYLDFLTHKPGASPREAAKAWVSISQSDTLDRLDNDRDFAAVQLSAFDLSKVEALKIATDRLATVLKKEDQGELRDIADLTKAFNMEGDATPDRDFRDLGHFCKNLEENGASEAAVKAGHDVLKALRGCLVSQHNDGEDAEDATGISVYLPMQFGDDKPAKGEKRKGFDPTHGYLETDFARQGKWDEWIEKLAP